MTSQQNFGQDPENFELPFSTDPQGLISYQPDTHLPIVRDLENISGFCRNSSRSQHVHQVTESNDVGNLQPRQRSKRSRPNSNSIHDEQISEIISLLSQATAEDIKKVLLYLRASTSLWAAGHFENGNDTCQSDQEAHPVAMAQSMEYEGDVLAAFSGHLQPDLYTSRNWDLEFQSQTTLQYGSTSAIIPPMLEHSIAENDKWTEASPICFQNLPGDRRSAEDLDISNNAPRTPKPGHLRNNFQRNSGDRSLGDFQRDSVQSTGSFNSIATDRTGRTKHSSTSTVGSGISVYSLRPPQRTMSSSGPPMAAPKASRPTSTNRKSSTASIIACTYSDCSNTFTKESDRLRHERHKHNPDLFYTCLLDTCTSICTEDCDEEQHNKPFRHPRADKIQKHLAAVHDLRWTKAEIPPSWQGEFDHDKYGWTCRLCGFNLGTWHDNADEIESHYKVQGSFHHNKSGWKCRICDFEIDSWQEKSDDIKEHHNAHLKNKMEMQKSFDRLSVEGHGSGEPRPKEKKKPLAKTKTKPASEKPHILTQDDEDFWG